MAIKFFNIRSGETQTAETEPQIAAMWASSDHSPNVTQGQDFGWRLAPEVVVEMKQIKQDMNLLQVIAQRISRPIDEITEPDILTYISAKTAPDHAPVADDTDYQDIYDQEVRRQLQENEKAEAPETTTTTTAPPEPTIEELEAQLEAKRAEAGNDTTTTTTTSVE